MCRALTMGIHSKLLSIEGVMLSLSCCSRMSSVPIYPWRRARHGTASGIVSWTSPSSECYSSTGGIGKSPCSLCHVCAMSVRLCTDAARVSTDGGCVSGTRHKVLGPLERRGCYSKIKKAHFNLVYDIDSCYLRSEYTFEAVWS